MDDKQKLVEIRKFDTGKLNYHTDLVIRECSLTILLNGERLIAISALPDNLMELAWGFLFSEGLILDKAEISGYDFDEGNHLLDFQVTIPATRISRFRETAEKTSGCGSALSSTLAENSGLWWKTSLKGEKILTLMKEFIGSSELFKSTGGVHLAGLVRDYQVLYKAEDLGRHNAVDKVIGRAFLKDDNLADCILLCSGRLSSEIVKKAVRTGIPLIISKSAVTSGAIRLGWEYRIVLIGFARGSRMNIYTGFQELEII
ncbi:MAG: formate dehydrogenase accessory sulfurtransferase FdhD [Candidatus Cloacimonetes bacterium]|nr:formate dehydrogenase accessory sulfurtransferase FdhD [Candidatus Cloacimonadota bacterium]